MGWNHTLSAQAAEEAIDYKVLLQKLERGLGKGNKRMLRDLGSLLNKKGVDAQVRKKLQKHCLFTPQEVNLATVNRDAFLSFFYNNHQAIFYSDYFGAFYITPIVERAVSFQPPAPIPEAKNNRAIQTKNHIGAYIQAFKAKNRSLILENIQALSRIKSRESIQFLQQQLANAQAEQVFGDKSSKIYVELIKAVENAPNYSSFTSILKLIKNEKVFFFEIEESLAKLTNVLTPKHLSSLETVTYFENLVDSLHSLSAMRTYGYEQLFSFQENFFYEKVDYYGKILCHSDNLPWVTQNAVTDLLRTQHPRVLLYLAAFIYKNRANVNPLNTFDGIKCMEELTKIPIQLDANKSDDYPQFLYYWWQHYENFEWDPKQNAFVNKEKKVLRIDHYEKQFRRLNSKNDDVALASYQELIEGNPEEVIELTGKYRPLLRKINAKLPEIKSHYLEQLVLLTAFCKENEVTYQLRPSLAEALLELGKTDSPQTRYQAENKLLQMVQLEDVTALEYWAILHTKNRALNLSIGRILDYFYSKNWNAVVDNHVELRLYLKKAQLFNAIGASGICNSYLKKFDTENTKQQAQLQYLLTVETDAGIKNQIAQIIVNETPENPILQISFADFLAHPMNYNKIELQVLSNPTESQLKQIAAAIQAEENPAVIKQYFLFLSYHPTLNAVPTLFKLIDEDKIIIHTSETTLTVGERVVPILEDIYDYSFASTDALFFDTQDWKKLWKTKRKKYKDWGQLFLEQKLQSLQAKEQLDIEEVNNFVEAAGTNAQFITAYLDLLPKVKPLKDVRRLSPENPLSLKNHLAYFKGLGLTYKHLDDIPKLFDIDQADLMIAFLETESADFGPLDKGAFYNNLFRAKWFLEYVLSGEISSKMVLQYQTSLQYYLDESDYLSEYEEQRTLQNLTHLASIGRPLAEKLEAALALDADDKLKANIQHGIIARVTYEDLVTVADYLPYLSSSPSQKSIAFLSQDFGLPIFELDSLGLVNFKISHQKLSEFEFYQHYLEIFGVDFLNEKGQLDFDKIHAILMFDVVSPLAGQGGSKRDYFVFGIIKLLEIHFKDNLGFHPKLNESQTFYTFASSKRAMAWQEYLQKKKLLSVNEDYAPSFNRIHKVQ